MQTASDRSIPRVRVNAGDHSIDRRGRARDAPTLFSYGFRPFFLFGAVDAAIMVPVWLFSLVSGVEFGGPLTGVGWHAHEMVFGYLAAVMAGFVLTAVPNWTGRLPLSGTPLALLAGLWLVGRIVMLVDPEPVSATVLDVSFLLALALAVFREVIAGKNFRNIPIGALLALFAGANLLDHLGASSATFQGYGVRLGLAVAAMMIALIGGRLTPSFTRNWMARKKLDPLPAAMDLVDRAALAVTAVGLSAWVMGPTLILTGICLIGSGGLLIARLGRWRGVHALREPMVLVLHIAYLWLGLAVLMLGLSVVVPWLVPASAAIHALTAGAIGTMTLAVMTRATKGHTGRAITSDGVTTAIFVLVTLGAVSRVLGSLANGPDSYIALVVGGGFLWSAAFVLFVIGYGPMLVSRRVNE